MQSNKELKSNWIPHDLRGTWKHMPTNRWKMKPSVSKWTERNQARVEAGPINHKQKNRNKWLGRFKYTSSARFENWEIIKQVFLNSEFVKEI